MQRTKADSVDNVVAQWLRLGGLETPLAEHRLMKAWPEAVAAVLGEGFGELAKKVTGNIYINAQILHVTLSSPALRQQLRMQAPQLVDYLNRASGVASPLITGVAFH